LKLKNDQELKQALLLEQKNMEDELKKQKALFHEEYQMKIDEFKKSN
jgi:hypothetical protein